MVEGKWDENRILATRPPKKVGSSISLSKMELDEHKQKLNTCQNFIKNLKFRTFSGLMERFLIAAGH